MILFAFPFFSPPALLLDPVLLPRHAVFSPDDTLPHYAELKPCLQFGQSPPPPPSSPPHPSFFSFSLCFLDFFLYSAAIIDSS